MSSEISCVLEWVGKTGAHPDSHWAVCGSHDVWRICRGEGKGADQREAKHSYGDAQTFQGIRHTSVLAVAHLGRNAESWWRKTKRAGAGHGQTKQRTANPCTAGTHQ